MNYKLHYEKLISKAQNRSILKSEYKEVHHIIPVCIGGCDSSKNLIALFPEEHLIAHLLLVKIYPLHYGLTHAATMMSGRINTNKKYGWLKRKHSKETSAKRLGTKLSDETKAKISKATKGKNNPMFGKQHSDDVKLKQSNLLVGKIPVIDKDGTRFLIDKTDSRWINEEVVSLTKGRIHTDDTKLKMSNSRKGVKKNIKKVTCPHCKKEGGGGNMTRYHFDNCKLKVLLNQ